MVPLGGRSETGKKYTRRLQAAGVEFIDENGGGGLRQVADAKDIREPWCLATDAAKQTRFRMGIIRICVTTPQRSERLWLLNSMPCVLLALLRVFLIDDRGGQRPPR